MAEVAASPSLTPASKPPEHDYECLYVVGGTATGLAPLPTVQRYDPVKDAWEAAEAMPTARHSLACAVLDNRLYVIGGWTDAGRSSVIEMYDPSSRTWDQTCERLEMDLRGHTCVPIGGYIYAVGGNGATAGSVKRYDARTSTWEISYATCNLESDDAFAVLGDHIYATGGSNINDRKLKTVQRYDATRDCWEPVKDMPVGRSKHAAAVLDGFLYVIGGEDDGEECLSRVDRFNPTRNVWDSVSPLAVGRQFLTTVTAGERIYAIGGVKADRSQATDVEAYDAVSNTWTRCTPMPTTRMAFAVGVLSCGVFP